jgi:hypothetical protein
VVLLEVFTGNLETIFNWTGRGTESKESALAPAIPDVLSSTTVMAWFVWSKQRIMVWWLMAMRPNCQGINWSLILSLLYS